MKNSAVFTLLLTSVFYLFTCGWLTGPDSHPLDGVMKTRPENIVTFTARNEVGNKILDRLIIADVENPKNSKILTGKEVAPYKPKFSPDKSKILFGDYTRKMWGVGPPLVIYDMASGSLTRLGDNIFGYRYVWNNDNSGFYYSETENRFVDIIFFDVTSMTKHTILETSNYMEHPVGFKGADTLIVESNNSEVADRTHGYYYMDLQGNYLSYIDNPKLELVNVNGIGHKAVSNLHYNDNIQMFVYKERSTDFEGYSISITNIDGSYYKAYTTGEYIDSDPAWSADGRYIVFTREIILIPGQFPKQMLYIIDTVTGSLGELIDPAKINGAVELFFADF